MGMPGTKWLLDHLYRCKRVNCPAPLPPVAGRLSSRLARCRVPVPGVGIDRVGFGPPFRPTILQRVVGLYLSDPLFWGNKRMA